VQWPSILSHALCEDTHARTCTHRHTHPPAHAFYPSLRTRTHTHIHTRTHAHAHTDTQTLKHTCVHARTRTRAHASASAWTRGLLLGVQARAHLSWVHCQPQWEPVHAKAQARGAIARHPARAHLSAPHPAGGRLRTLACVCVNAHTQGKA